MAYALVGLGTASQGAASAAVTPAWGTGSRTVGNLLICFCSVTGTGTVPTTPSGWTIATSGGAGTSVTSQIYYKIATGTDTAPTIAAITSGLIAAQLAEFSNNDANPADQSARSLSATSSPVTITLSGADAASGELIIMAGGDFRSASRAPNDTWTSNHATITQAGSNNGVSTPNHYSFGYSLATTSNSGADTAVMTCSVTTSITGLATCAATFKVIPPTGPTAQQQAGFFMFF